HLGAQWGEDRERVGQMQAALLDKLEGTPGVEAAGVAHFLPAGGATLRDQGALVETAGAGGADKVAAGSRSISRGYLKALGAPILAGTDCPDLRALKLWQAQKGLVNRRFVEMFGQGRNLVGQHFRMLDQGYAGDAPATEIVGVVGDLRED